MEINMVAGKRSAPENIPPKTDITVKSTRVILSNPIIMQNPLAINARNMDIIIVKMIAELIFWFNKFDFLSFGDRVPIWRFEPNLEPKAPNIFPLIPIAPGINTKSPGRIKKVSVILLRSKPAIKSPIAHMKRAINASLNAFDVSLRKLIILLLKNSGILIISKNRLENIINNCTIQFKII